MSRLPDPRDDEMIADHYEDMPPVYYDAPRVRRWREEEIVARFAVGVAAIVLFALIWAAFPGGPA